MPEEPDDTPWESGLVADGEGGSPENEPGSPLRRIAELELTVMALVDLLAERGHIGRIELPNRIAGIRKETAEAAERAKAEAAAREEARREATVDCVACDASIPKRESFYSSQGVVCASCHARLG